MIEVSHLSKKYGTHPAIEDLSFTVGDGQIFGLLGPNGAGKSTTFRMLCGLSRPTSGQCSVDGVDLLRAGSAARSRLGYMAQKFSLYLDIPVRENILTCAELYGLAPERRKALLPVLAQALELPFVQEVLATARAAGAVVVFAHPTVYKSMPLLRELVKEGMVDGIEVDHPRNSPEDRAECIALCAQYGLIRTGGTDFHGSNHKHPHPVGTCTTPDDQIARIEALAQKRK